MDVTLGKAEALRDILSCGLLGEGALMVDAGAMPTVASALMRRFASAQIWLPGRRSFAALLALAGAGWVAQGLGLVG